MASVKVVACLPGWPRLLAIALASIAIEWGLSALDDATRGKAHEVIGILLLSLLWVVLPVILSFSEHRISRAIMEGLAIGLPAVATNIVLIAIANGRWNETAGSLAMLFAEAGGLLIAVRLVALWVVRTLGCGIVMQTGSLCWNCAYDLTGNLSGVCPECGNPISGEKPGE